MSRRRGSGQGFIGRLDWSGWFCLHLHVGFVVATNVVFSRSTPGNASRNRSCSGLALLVGRCRLLGAVHQIEEPQPRKRHRVAKSSTTSRKQARKAADHDFADVSSGAGYRVGRRGSDQGRTAGVGSVKRPSQGFGPMGETRRLRTFPRLSRNG